MRTLLFAALALLLGASEAHAQRAFQQGQNRLSLYLGSSSSGDSAYVIGGLGFGHFVLDGLEIGVQADYWFGPSPTITRVAPEIRYILPTDTVAPYAGVFYRHWFYGGGLDDFDTAGGRAGLIYDSGGAYYIGAGGVYETVLTSCELDCSYIYPEVTIALVF